MPYNKENVEKKREANRRYAEKNKEKVREKNRKYMADIRADPVKAEEQRKYIRAWRDNNPERSRSYRKRGRNVAQMVWGDRSFELLYEQQDGRCEGCSDPLLPGQATHVDHNHTTGKVRCLLCRTCNMGLGLLKDSPEILRRLASMVERER